MMNLPELGEVPERQPSPHHRKMAETAGIRRMVVVFQDRWILRSQAVETDAYNWPALSQLGFCDHVQAPARVGENMLPFREDLD
jgi:hypothetical protein